MEKIKSFKYVLLGFIKIISFIMATIIFQRIALIPLSFISKTYWSQYDGRGLNEPWFISSSIVLFCASFTICLVFLKYVDKKPLAYLRLFSVNYKKYLATGISISFILVVLFTLLNIISGNTKLTIIYSSLTNAFFYFLLLGVGIFVLVVYEELVYRGYVLKTLEYHFGIMTSIIISSLLFSVAHFLRPDASLLAFINIFLSGVMLSIICIYYNSLWVPIGIHFGWNYFLWLFNYPLSSQRWTNPIFKLNYHESNLITGSQFGPEDSIILTIILAIAIGYFLFKYKVEDRVKIESNV